jgi:predicted DCC family thiol-disulfide oxidoreductase YuxK
MSGRAIILFDGVCNLCNGAVQFILTHDPAGRFQFASLQSDAARRILGGEPQGETIVLAESPRIYTKSTAALRIARHLRFPWPLLSAFLLIPRPLRDAVYDWIARHRYAWFGRRESCLLPKQEFQNRFVD